MISMLKLRMASVFFACCFLYIIIIFNLYLVQIRNALFFSSLGAQQYNVTITQAPPRAPILDRTGKHYLAMNQKSIAAFIIPNQVTDPKGLEEFLNKHFPHTTEQFHRKKNKRFMYIKRRLSEKDLGYIQEYAHPDIHLLHESSRFYPVPSAGPVVGMTDVDNNGLFGIELQCNTLLTGKPTTYCLEKDARSGYFYFKKETKVTGHAGTPVQLTIDADLQFLVHEALHHTINQFKAKEGAVIVMDPANGEIIAMVSSPHFNPDNTVSLDLEQTKNKLLTESYELGSVIKVFNALAALEEGVVEPDELIDCKDTKTTYLEGRKINTWKAHGVIPFKDVVALSNNIGIAIVAKRLDEKLYDHYMRMGFGQKTGITFPGENKGFVNHPANWSKQSIISLSYGYEISASILQLACAFCMIANNGYKVQPRLTVDNNQHPTSTPLYSSQSIDAIKGILVHSTQHGTGRRTAIKGYTVMSKTGTANLIENGTYSMKKNLYTCAGIVQKNNYQRVIVTFIREAHGHNLFAATVAAPLFERVAEKMLIHERVL